MLACLGALLDADLRRGAAEREHGGVEAARQVEEEEERAVGQVAAPADLALRVGRVNHLQQRWGKHLRDLWREKV